MYQLENQYGSVYYMTKEETGNVCGIKYTKIYIFSQELGFEFGDTYINAVDHEQPNVWNPYDLTKDSVTIYTDRSKARGFIYRIVKELEHIDSWE